MISTMPLFYFKPTICWVDDDNLFLDAANIAFGDKYQCLSLASADEALNFFKDYRAPLNQYHLSREFTESDVFKTKNHYPIDIDLSSIHHLAENKVKYNEVSLLIVDYHMPNMNGMMLLDKLGHLTCKKILLTGEASLDKAIDAFNQDLIDKFIKKGNDITDTLQPIIHDLNYQYFCQKTKTLQQHLETSTPTLFSDYVFIQFFSELRKENRIKEFYLLDRQGSFLLRNNDGQESYLVIFTESEKNAFLHVNDDIPDQVSHLLNAVKQEKLLPFFGIGKEPWEFNYHEWQAHFYPANILYGREKYYWAVINK